jgi:hypothetical protein
MKCPVRICFRILVFISITGNLPSLSAQTSFASRNLEIALSRSGQVTGLIFQPYHNDYLASGQSAPLLQVRCGGTWESPSSAVYHADHARETTGILDLAYAGSGVRISIKVEMVATHIDFGIVSAEPAARIERVLWGPFPTRLSSSVGETIGVVHDDDFAFGLQVLNIKTQGGFPGDEEGSDTSRGSTAKRTSWGSILQAYSINRTLYRTVDAWWWYFPGMQLKPLNDETVAGSKIALFGCPVDKIQETIGEIRKKENLPHPMIGNDRMKDSLPAGK